MTKDATVTALHGAEVRNDRRAHFVNHAAASFDAYLRDFGAEPDALVMVMGGLKQASRASWTVCGASEGGPTTMISLAMATLIKEAMNG